MIQTVEAPCNDRQGSDVPVSHRQQGRASCVAWAATLPREIRGAAPKSDGIGTRGSDFRGAALVPDEIGKYRFRRLTCLAPFPVSRNMGRRSLEAAGIGGAGANLNELMCSAAPRSNKRCAAKSFATPSTNLRENMHVHMNASCLQQPCPRLAPPNKHERTRRQRQPRLPWIFATTRYPCLVCRGPPEAINIMRPL